jgi:hypothetical protein
VALHSNVSEVRTRNVLKTLAATIRAMAVRFGSAYAAPGYSESWVEGMVVLHSPSALIPLDPDLTPGTNHEFLQSDGRIMPLVPDFHPVFSMTEISVG